MKQEVNIINLEYTKTKKVSVCLKTIAFILVIIFATVPMYEFILYYLLPSIDQCTYGIAGTCGCIIQ